MAPYKLFLKLANRQYKALSEFFICRWQILNIKVSSYNVQIQLKSLNGFLVQSGFIEFPISHPIALQILEVVRGKARDRVLPRVLVLVVFSRRNKYFYLEYLY